MDLGGDWPGYLENWAKAVGRELIDGFWLKANEEFWPQRWPDGSLVYSQEASPGQWFLMRENAWTNYGFENFEKFTEALFSKKLTADSPSAILLLGLYRHLAGVGLGIASRGAIFVDQKLIMHFIVIREEEFQKVRSLAHQIDPSCQVQRDVFFPEFFDALKRVLFKSDNTRVKLLRLGVFFGFLCLVLSVVALFWKKGIFLAILFQMASLWIFGRVRKE